MRSPNPPAPLTQIRAIMRRRDLRSCIVAERRRSRASIAHQAAPFLHVRSSSTPAVSMLAVVVSWCTLLRGIRVSLRRGYTCWPGARGCTSLPVQTRKPERWICFPCRL